MKTKKIKWAVLGALLMVIALVFAGCDDGTGKNSKNKNKGPDGGKQSNGPFKISTEVTGRGSGTITGLPATAMYNDELTFTVNITNGLLRNVNGGGVDVVRTALDATEYTFRMPRRAVKISADIGIPIGESAPFEHWVSPLTQDGVVQDLGDGSRAPGGTPVAGPLLGYGYNEDGWWGTNDMGPEGMGYWWSGDIEAQLQFNGPDRKETQTGYIITYYTSPLNGSSAWGRNWQELAELPRQSTGRGAPGPENSAEGLKGTATPCTIGADGGWEGISFWAKDYTDALGYTKSGRTGALYYAVFTDSKDEVLRIDFQLDEGDEWTQFFVDRPSKGLGDAFDFGSIKAYLFGIVDPGEMGNRFFITELDFYKY